MDPLTSGSHEPTRKVHPCPSPKNHACSTRRVTLWVARPNLFDRARGLRISRSPPFLGRLRHGLQKHRILYWVDDFGGRCDERAIDDHFPLDGSGPLDAGCCVSGRGRSAALCCRVPRLHSVHCPMAPGRLQPRVQSQGPHRSLIESARSRHRPFRAPPLDSCALPAPPSAGLTRPPEANGHPSIAAPCPVTCEQKSRRRAISMR